MVVIGGGPGGYAAAFAAADLGLDVTLVDDAPNPGGVCLYRGCIPSKALLHAAHVLNQAKQAGDWGIEFGQPSIDLDRLRGWKDGVVQKMTEGLGGLTKQRGITFVQGRASFLDAHRVCVAVKDGDQMELSFEHAILATGSQPVRIPSLSIDSPRVMDSTDALKLEEIPDSLLVVGGGYIGLELATVYHALGSEVSVVELTPELLPGADRDLVRPLAAKLKRELHAVHLKTQVVSLEEKGNAILARLKGEDGEEREVSFDRVLIAVGRRPNSANLGLEGTKVELTERGFVKVDSQRRTAEPSIFAIGDVAGEPMLAHKASHEGRVAAEVISGRRVAFEPQAIPAVVFTDPEVAWCGLTQGQAKEEGRKVRVVRFPWGASGRASTLGGSDGVTKLIVDPESDQVLGVGICGPGAGELIAEGVLAVEMAALASDVMLSVHPHPTLSETLMEAAESVYGSSTHFYRKQ